MRMSFIGRKLLEHDGLFLGMRYQSGGKEFVTENRLFGRDATEPVVELSGALGQESSPHLEEAIGEAGLENTSGDGGKGPVKAEIGALPGLFLAALKSPKRFRFLGAVF